MYRRESEQLEFEDFLLPFDGRLRSDNRWVVLARHIPWGMFEERYAAQLADSGMGAPAKPVRMALGALIIKQRLGLSDEETVEQIRENPYLQYFLGLPAFQDESPFDPSMFVHFRKRLGDLVQEVNEYVVASGRAKVNINKRPGQKNDKNDSDNDKPGSDVSASTENKTKEPLLRGKLIVDATCAPADITYPTDLKLTNDAREKSEEIIDALHKPDKGKVVKPRTYRKRARKDFLNATKLRKLSWAKSRRAVGKQLRYLRRNLAHIERIINKHPGRLLILTKRLYRNLLVINEVYRQQRTMWETRSRRIDSRIVSCSQPHVRPIVRGKAGSPVEFGAKLIISVVDGYTLLDHVSFDAFNEGGYLIEQIDQHRERFGCYPESVHADKIYRNRENRRYCRDRGIRLSGPPLGRRPIQTESNRRQLAFERRQALQDERDRNIVEGRFGWAKRSLGLDRIMAKLDVTSRCAIAMSILTMNLEKWLRALSLCQNIVSTLSSLFAYLFAEPNTRRNMEYEGPSRWNSASIRV